MTWLTNFVKWEHKVVDNITPSNTILHKFLDVGVTVSNVTEGLMLGIGAVAVAGPALAAGAAVLPGIVNPLLDITKTVTNGVNDFKNIIDPPPPPFEVSPIMIIVGIVLLFLIFKK